VATTGKARTRAPRMKIERRERARRDRRGEGSRREFAVSDKARSSSSTSSRRAAICLSSHSPAAGEAASTTVSAPSRLGFRSRFRPSAFSFLPPPCP
jgi:hypothetical protein